LGDRERKESNSVPAQRVVGVLLFRKIKDESRTWVLVGAKKLAEILLPPHG